MPRIAEVPLSEVWDSPSTREKVAEGALRIKLPILPHEYPKRHAMRAGARSIKPLDTETGLHQMWLLHDQIIFLLTTGKESVFWVGRYPTVDLAMFVFAETSRNQDEEEIASGDLRLKFFGSAGRQAQVTNLDCGVLVSGLVYPAFFEHRSADATGLVMCRAFNKRDDLWVVLHTNGTLAVYHSSELGVD